MKTFRSHLKEKLKDRQFKELYTEERQLAELSLNILSARERIGLSQAEVARKAQVTQQQVSKIEQGVNCNMVTFLKICNALGIKVELDMKPARHAA